MSTPDPVPHPSQWSSQQPRQQPGQQPGQRSGPQLVVGAAILRAGRVLAARRTSPPALAGRWEFPGGKVEVGETPEEALVREIAEELGVIVRVGEWLGARSRIDETRTLLVATARIGEARAADPDEPEPQEDGHDQLRWLSADELDEVPWAEADLPFLPELRQRLVAHAERLRGVFFEEEDAVAVAERLTAEGWEADLVRERYQGEDDDEDHPWAVATDAPELVLDLLVDEHDGWLDYGDLPMTREPSTPPPAAATDVAVPLPTEPRRIKRPDAL